MADYRTHITTSGILGVGFGLVTWTAGELNSIQATLAAVLTGGAGMFPDLDSDSGKPVREVFGLLAAMTPFLLQNRLYQWGGGTEGALLLSVLVYIGIRYGGATLLSLCSVHRGMFHSIPALLIASEGAFLAYDHPSLRIRVLMAIGVGLGFASHLILDEIYSVRWNGTTLQLKPSAGSAVKLLGKSWGANIFCMGVAMTLGYAVLIEAGVSMQADKPAVDEKAGDSILINRRGAAEVDRDEGEQAIRRPIQRRNETIQQPRDQNSRGSTQPKR